MKKKIATLALAGTLLTGAGVAMGVPMSAFAADGTTSTTAGATARTPAKWMTDTLKGLVDKGTITQTQSDQVAKALADARPAGEGPGGHGGKGGFGGPGASNAAAAKALGLSEADLRTALQTDKSLAAVAKAKNVDVQKVIDAIVADENTRIDQQVKDGKLTQTEADARKAKTVERVTAMVNSTDDHMGRGGPRFDGNGTPPPAPGATTPSTTAAPAATSAATA